MKSVPITLFRGEDVEILFTLSPAEDITGWTILFSVKAPGDLGVARSATITAAAEGVFRVDLKRADTLGLSAGGYHYDAWRTNEGVQRVLAAGQLIVLREARASS